jgi:hypothetical protein
LAAADTYSLGKVLYWLFTHDVYDGHEEEYGSVPERHLAHLFPSDPEFTFIDELVSKLVRRNPAERFANANDLQSRVQQVIDRIDAGGHVLDLRIPQRCLYCGVGKYRPAHDLFPTAGFPRAGKPKFPDIAQRKSQEYPPYPEESMYAALRAVRRDLLATPQLGSGIPLFLICDKCGNIQFFRLDAADNGACWRP